MDPISIITSTQRDTGTYNLKWYIIIQKMFTKCLIYPVTAYRDTFFTAV